MNDYMKTIVSGMKAYADNIKADWNQNDSSAPDYIKNRTHWTEQGPDIVILSETKLTAVGQLMEGIVRFMIPSVLPLSADDVCFVTWNGKKYKSTAKLFNGVTALGNLNIAGLGSDTGEPFIIVPNEEQGLSIIATPYAGTITEDTIIEATISIIKPGGELVHKIDKKYLPEMNNIKNIMDGNSKASVRTIGASDGLGYYAFAEGYNTKAEGYASHAEGTVTQASGDKSHAEGYNTIASGSCSHAEGSYTKALGGYSHAEGFKTEASGNYSHAEGEYTNASGDWSHAEGAYTTALGDYSHAEGERTSASKPHSHAEGNRTNATGESSHAEGSYTKASGDYSHAEGSETLALGAYAHTEGKGGQNGSIKLTGESQSKRYKVSAWNNNIKAGRYLKSDNATAQIVYTWPNTSEIELDQTLDWTTEGLNDTEVYFIGGIATGDYSHTEGGFTVAKGTAAHAEGSDTIASGNYSHAEGSDTIASNHCSHAEGKGTNATGKYSHAEGWYTAATGNNAHAEGSGTSASGLNSHAEGYSTKANGPYSHAEGSDTIASGNYSHAEGKGSIGITAPFTITGGSNANYTVSKWSNEIRLGRILKYNDKMSKIISYDNSSLLITLSEPLSSGTLTDAEVIFPNGVACCDATHIEGYATNTFADYSHAEGYRTEAYSSCQHVQGKYNIKNYVGNYAHIVGNGESEDARSNAHTLDWNGNAWFAGNIKMGGTGYDDENAIDISSISANIKTYNNLDQIGLSNDDMSSTDFLANIKAINTALGEDDSILYLTTTNADNLHLSAVDKLSSDVNKELGYVMVEGNGKFVAVTNSDDNNIVAYSEDGVNWEQSTMPISAIWNSVTYGNGKFVAVASYSEVVVYSEDGINWEQSTLPVSESWYSVTYGNGKFVAVANGSEVVVYSEDGINWEQSTMPYSELWKSVTYGNGKFVAVASNIDVVAYSEDGINWEQSTLPVSENWISVTYGNGKFIAVAGYGSNVFTYSEDGINWEQSILPVLARWQSVTYGNGKFVAVAGYGSNVFVYSEDGINWEQSTLPVSESWYSVTYGNGKFVAVANGSEVVVYSEDGINWEQSTMPVSTSWISVAYCSQLVKQYTSVPLSLKISRTGDTHNAITTDLVYNSDNESMYVYSCNYYNDTISNFVSITHPDGFLPTSGGNITGDLTVNSKKIATEEYVTEQLNSVSSSKLISHVLPIEATEENQTIFPINLETFDAANDTVLVQDGITLLLPNSGFTIENNAIVMTTPRGLGDTGSILILKNTPVLEDEVTISGAVIENNSITLDKLSADITTELDEIKKSASDGKALVAGAITDKGIETAADATFETMANNIDSIITLDSVPSLEAAEITPGASDQVIAAGNYLRGDQTIKGDANLVAANIAKGKSIFGVTGTYDPAASAWSTIYTNLETSLDPLLVNIRSGGDDYVNIGNYKNSTDVNIALQVPRSVSSTNVTSTQTVPYGYYLIYIGYSALNNTTLCKEALNTWMADSSNYSGATLICTGTDDDYGGTYGVYTTLLVKAASSWTIKPTSYEYTKLSYKRVI